MDDILIISGIINNAIAVFLNVVLSLLIIFKRSTRIGTYRYLILSVVSVELGLSISLALNEGHFLTNDVGWVYMSITRFLPYNVHTFFALLSAETCLLITVALAFSFLYRYAAMCSPTLLSWFENPKKRSIFYVIFLMVAFGAGCELYLCFQPKIEFTKRFMSRPNHRNISLYEYGYMGTAVYDDYGNLSIEALVTLGSWTSLFVITSSVYIFAAYKMIKKFNELQNLSSKTNREHKNLFKLLLLQTFAPVLSMHTPVTGSYILAFLKIDAGHYTDMYSYATTYVCLLDPIFVLYFIKDYRTGLIELMMAPFRKIIPSLNKKTTVFQLTVTDGFNSSTRNSLV